VIRVVADTNVYVSAIVFGGTLQLNRTYDFERDEAVLDGMRLIEGMAAPFYLSKFFVNLVMLIIIGLFSSVLSAFLFNAPLYQEWARLLWPLLLGIVGLAALGTSCSTMVMTLHKRDILLPAIFYPLLMPLSIAVIKAMGDGVDTNVWLKILFAFDVIFVTASLLVFEKIMES